MLSGVGKERKPMPIEYESALRMIALEDEAE